MIFFTKGKRKVTIMMLVVVMTFLIRNSESVIIKSVNDNGRTENKGIQSIDPIGSGIFFVSGILTSFANTVGCCIIITANFNKWKKRKTERLSSSQRFPLYMSIMDLSIALITIPNLFYPMQMNKLLNPGGLCKGIGFIMSMLFMMNMMLMAVMAVVTYLRMCKRWVARLGKYDWILGIIMIVPSLLISMITVIYNGYGEDNYWCFMNRTDKNGGKISMIALMVFAYIVIAITTFCYLNVIKRIHGVEATLIVAKRSRKRPMSEMFRSSTLGTFSDGLESRPPSFFMNINQPIHTLSLGQQKIASNIARATRKMASYIILQLIQYAPIIIYCLCFLFDVDRSWVYTLLITLINLGGIGKTLVFLNNEIFFKQEKQFSCCNPKVPYNSRNNSLTNNFNSWNSSNNSLIKQENNFNCWNFRNNSLTYPPKPLSSRKNHSTSWTDSIIIMSTIDENDSSALINKNCDYEEIVIEEEEEEEGEEKIDVDYLIPIIFSNQSIIMSPPPCLSFNFHFHK